MQESQIIQFAVGVITLSHMIKQIIQFRQQVCVGYIFSTGKRRNKIVKKIHVNQDQMFKHRHGLKLHELLIILKRKIKVSVETSKEGGNLQLSQFESQGN